MTHPQYIRKRGPYRKRPTSERFWEKVNKESGRTWNGTPCWQWLAGCSNGYGHFGPSHGETVQAHRYAYESLVGPIPADHDLDHLCRNHGCVNPAHVEPVARGVNVLRGESSAAQRARQTHCKNGHAFDEANTFVNRHGHRKCRACARVKERARYHRAK